MSAPKAAVNRWHVLLLLVLTGLMLIPGTGQLPLVDRDEPRFAQATVEMMDRDEWVIPYFNGNYRFDKPVLVYWLMRASYSVFGVNEFAARFHSMVSAFLIALAIYLAGRRWYSARIGLLAGIGFLTCFQTILNGRSCVADMPMILAVTVAQICLYELLSRPADRPANRWMLGFYTAMGIGFLTKGPIALMVPALTMVLFRWVLWRRPLTWRHLKPHIGLPILLAIICAWSIPALIQTDGGFWRVGMGDNVVKRGVEVFNGRFYMPLFYLGTAFISLFPWIAFAGQGWQTMRRNWDSNMAFLAAWILSLYVIFTFYATQLPHYVMPAFPAIFLILGHAITEPEEETGWMKWLRRFAVGVGAVLVTVPVLFGAGLLWANGPWPAIVVVSGLAIIMAGLFTAGRMAHRNGPTIMVLVAFVVAAIGPGLLGAGLRPIHPAKRLEPIFATLPPSTEMMGCGFTEGTLVFYAHRQWQFTDRIDQMRPFLAQPGPRMAVVLATETKLDRLIGWHIKRLFDDGAVLDREDWRTELENLDTTGYQVREISGMNMGRFSWVTLKVLIRQDAT